MKQASHWIHVHSVCGIYKFSPERHTSPAMQTRLQEAYAVDGYALCQCKTLHGGPRLMIKYINQKYHLAKHPHTGSEHAENCSFYSRLNKEGGQQGYAEGVIKEKSNARLQIKLTYALQSREADQADFDGVPPIAPARRSTQGQPSMSILGLLHLLWESAGLNLWRPRMEGKRTASLVSYLLNQQASTIDAGKTCLSDVLLLPAERQKVTALKNETRTQQAIQKKNRMVAIAELATYTEDRARDPAKLWVKDYHGLPHLNINTALWLKTLTRFPAAAAGWQAGQRVMAIALTDVPFLSKNNIAGANILQLGLMLVSDRYIPVDSSHEHHLESRLHAQNRHFTKPLRYDAALDEYLPDFCLIDVPGCPSLPLEVFGMATPDYLAHRHVKATWYNDKFGPLGWWFWDATADPLGENMRSFPQAR